MALPVQLDDVVVLENATAVPTVAVVGAVAAAVTEQAAPAPTVTVTVARFESMEPSHAA